MNNYIDGFVFPIAHDRLIHYTQLSSKIANIWKEHGALDYFEYVADDMTLTATASFTEVLTAREDETIVFGWVVFDSRESRDLVNKKVTSDPRMQELSDLTHLGFDPKRMAYAGFKPLFSTC